MDHTIKIAVWDWDMTSSDDLIGETSIDLENRIFTNHRATCGLSAEYHEQASQEKKTLYFNFILSTGYRAWRDYEQPTNILERLCKKFHLSSPEYTETSVRIGYKEFEPSQKISESFIQLYIDFCINQNVVAVSNINRLKEICALAALRRWKEIPVIGCSLVPEHVETRSLYHPSKPGIEQVENFEFKKIL